MNIKQYSTKLVLYCSKMLVFCQEKN